MEPRRGLAITKHDVITLTVPDEELLEIKPHDVRPFADAVMCGPFLGVNLSGEMESKCYHLDSILLLHLQESVITATVIDNLSGIRSRETNSLLAWMDPPIRCRYNRHRADYNCRYVRCPSYQSCGLTRLPSYQRCERSCEPRMTFMTRAKYKK